MNYLTQYINLEEYLNNLVKIVLLSVYQLNTGSRYDNILYIVNVFTQVNTNVDF